MSTFVAIVCVTALAAIALVMWITRPSESATDPWVAWQEEIDARKVAKAEDRRVRVLLKYKAKQRNRFRGYRNRPARPPV